MTGGIKMSEWTTIAVRNETKEELDIIAPTIAFLLKKKRVSYDDIIKCLLKYAKLPEIPIVK